MEGKPDYCFRDIRRKDSVKLLQAFKRNVRTCRYDVKGNAQVEDPQEQKYRCEAHGRNIS